MLNDFINRVAIGTTKLGMPYGAVEPKQVKAAQAQDIFHKAAELSFDCFDTAPSYGNAEQLIGQYLSSELRRFCVTKVAKVITDEINDESLQIVEDQFQASLQFMKTPTCYGLLVHDVQDLFKPGAEKLVEWMQSLKDKGRVNKIGVSVYTPEEADDLFERFDFDLVQLPCNIYDQRFLQSGAISKLRAKKVEIHARSLFLKGLILKPNVLAKLPQGIIAHNELFHQSMNEKGLKAYDACLAFAKLYTQVDRWVIGVSSKQQLMQLLSNENQITETIDFEQWAYSEKAELDPRTW